MNINELRRRAGIITEEIDTQWTSQVADAFARYLMGDGKQALNQLGQLSGRGPSYKNLSGDPGVYNETYKDVVKLMGEAVQRAMYHSDQSPPDRGIPGEEFKP